MGFPIIDGVLKVVDTVGGLFGSWLDRKKIESQGKVDVAKAKIEGDVKRAQTVAEGEIQYDQTAAEGMRYSWKDEWLTLLLSTPFIMCFIPYTQPYVEKGFQVLRDSTPEWYQWCFIGIIVASFGLRGWAGIKRSNGKSDASQ